MIRPIQKPLDVLFVSADSSIQAYQELAKTYSAIEPPTWALLLAQSCRSKGYGSGILDCTAERLSSAQSVERIHEANPRLVCFVVYGQNPNSGTTNMIGPRVAEYAANVIRSSEFLASRLHMPYVNGLVDQHLSGKANKGAEVWSLMNLALWHEVWIEGQH